MHDYRLHVFRVAGELLNFTRAASRLHISQPAVTQHIKQLEEHYAQALFVRTAGGTALTAAGRTLLEHVIHVESLHARIDRQLREGQTQVMGSLKLGASTTIAQYLLPRWLGHFRRLHPQVELTLRMGNTEEVTGAMLANRIDLGLIEGPSGRRELKTGLFAQDEIIPVVAQGHPLTKKTMLTVEDVLATPCVLREPGSGTRQVVETALKKARINPRKLAVMLESDSTETIKGMIETGAGLAFMSRLALRHELARGCLVEVRVTGLKIVRPLYVLYPQGPHPTGPAGVFMDFLKEANAGA